MRFHLNFEPKSSEFKLDHSKSCFLIGSCFSDNIGEKLKERKFKIISNPNGNLFNPFSIHTALQHLFQKNEIDSNFFIQRDSMHYSYFHHSSVNANSQKTLIEKIQTIKEESKSFLQSCDYLFITFGTAYYFQLISHNIIVANCHKQASSNFEKRLAKPEDIVKDYQILIKELKSFNPNLKIVFTVSPVKHLKDGIVENTLSKSTLILAIHQLVSEIKDCFYFPAYELVTDDLRDYRFYKEDLAHPNQQAIDYVWEKFSDTFFDAKTLELNHKIHKLQLALNHRKMQENQAESEKLNDFILKQKEEIKKLAPEIEF